MTIYVYNAAGSIIHSYIGCTGVTEPADKNGILKFNGKRDDQADAGDWRLTLGDGCSYKLVPTGS